MTNIFQMNENEFAVFYDRFGEESSFKNALYVEFFIGDYKVGPFSFLGPKSGIKVAKTPKSKPEAKFTYNQKEVLLWTFYAEAIRLYFSDGPGQIEEYIPYDSELEVYEKEFDEIIEEDKQFVLGLYEDLLKEISLFDKALFDELSKEMISELIRDELSEEVSPDVLRQARDLQGKFRVEDKEIVIALRRQSSFSHKKISIGDTLLIEKFYYTFDKPIYIRKPTEENLFYFYNTYLREPLLHLIKNEITKGLGAFIFRLTYYYDGEGTFIPDGIPVQRLIWGEQFFSAEDYLRQLEKLFLLNAIEAFVSQYIKFRPDGIIVSGFTFENGYKRV